MTPPLSHGGYLPENLIQLFLPAFIAHMAAGKIILDEVCNRTLFYESGDKLYQQPRPVILLSPGRL